VNTLEDVLNLSLGTHVSLIGKEDHPKNGQLCRIIAIVPNPSGREANQWYDVRFVDGSIGRFHKRYLVTEAGNRKEV
jgi:hypothetical protein